MGIGSKCIPVSACNETACNKTLMCSAILFITVKAYFSKDEPVPDKESKKNAFAKSLVLFCRIRRCQEIESSPTQSISG